MDLTDCVAPTDETSATEASGRERFFDCTFVWAPNELVGDEPYVVFEDEGGDPFFLTLLHACRGEAGFRGVVRDPAEAARFKGLVFVEGPVWRRRFEALQAAGLRGAGARVVLYFEDDPSGFWDFAKACGDSLGDIVRAGGLRPEDAPALSDYLEHWVGGRVAAGRILPMARYYTRDFHSKLIENGGAIAKVMAALADEESRAAFSRILFGTNEQVFSSFARSVFGPQQYMDISRIRPGDVFINCGVGSGWELPYFLARLQGRGAIHSFDPNMCYAETGYGAFIDLFSDMITDHMIVLGDHDGELKLPVSQANMVRSDASVRDDVEGVGFETYTCRTLDSLMAEGLAPRVDHIKMDVEGGEIYILKGAAETIRRFRPRLSVAIYHEPEHFWDYAGHLIDMLEDYRFYVRQYGYSRFETLLYAIPAEDVASGSGEERLLHGPASPNAGAPHQEPVLLYARDRRGADRHIYSGPQRVLARIQGVDWETADMRPGPQIDTDEVVGVIERGDEAVIFAKHAYGADNTQLTVGETRDDVEIAWIAATGVSPDAVCIVVTSEDGVPRVLACETAHNAARLFRYADGALSPEFDLVFHGVPVAGLFSRDGVLTLDITVDDGMRLCEQSFTATGKVAEKPVAPVGADPIVGAALIKSYGREGGTYRQAFLAHREGADAITVLERTRDGLRELRTLRWDPRLEPVGAGLLAARAASENMRRWAREEAGMTADTMDRSAQIAAVNEQRLRQLNETGRLPYSVMVQLSAKCNLRCRMCGHVGRTPNVGFMSEEMFAHVLDRCRSDGITRLHTETAWGEPLLHPKIFELLEMASDFEIILSTNGTPLNPARIERLAAMNLAQIQVSFGGHDARSYESTYQGGRFDRVSENIRALKASLVAHECDTDFCVNGVVYGDDDEIEKTVRYLMSLGVERKEIILVRPHNYGGHRYESEALAAVDETIQETYKQNYLKEPPVLCSVLMHSPAVLIDGRVTACGCIDNDGDLTIGDIRENSVTDLRFGERYEQMLQAFMKGDLSQYKICADCDVPYGENRNVALDVDT